MVSAGIPTRHGDGMVVFGGDTLVKGENKGDYLNDVWLLQPKPHGSESAVWHPSADSDSGQSDLMTRFFFGPHAMAPAAITT